MDEPIRLVLVTGFLGAGKTTFLNRILASSRGRTAVLVNEYGKIGVDGALVDQRDGLSVFEVADGSIFCTCKSASFVGGLRMFARMAADRRPERLIVEASGMSDPSGLTRLIRTNRLAGDYAVAGVVCLVDSVTFHKVVTTLPAIKRQVEAADVILVNKTDLAERETIDETERVLRTINDRAEIVRAVRGDGIGEELWTGTSVDIAGELVSCNRPETRPAALHLLIPDVRRAPLDRFLSKALPSTHRIKGWLHVDGEWLFISDNSGRIELEVRTPPPGPAPGLTVICDPEVAEHVAALWRETVVYAASDSVHGRERS